jgi:glycopeptide antibiotics resistance protein
VKNLHKTILTIYLLFLLWLVLFKFSYEPFSVLANYQSRSLNLVPFLGYSTGNVREMMDNFAAFVPFGLLLAVNFKQVKLWEKLAFIFMFSAAVESAQFIFAIGTTDITDVITNTLGGFFGLAVYGLASKYISHEKLDRFIVIAVASVIALFMLFRVLVFKVQY